MSANSNYTHSTKCNNRKHNFIPAVAESFADSHGTLLRNLNHNTEYLRGTQRVTEVYSEPLAGWADAQGPLLIILKGRPLRP